MSATYEVIEKNKVKITVSVAPETFEAGIARSYEKNKKKFQIKGFRPGKAPRKMIEQAYGIGVFYDDAFNFVIPGEYDAAVKELGLAPVDEPAYDITEIESNTKLVFTAEVFVKPEVVLGDYKGIEVTKVDENVTDEDVDAELKKMAEEDFRLVSVTDRPSQIGDTCEIDFVGSVDGVEFPGGAGENYPLELGSGSFIPGFEEQLVGKNVDDDVDVNVTFPEDYQAEDLKGKAALFKVKIHSIKTKEIPEINDDFAAEKSNFDTLDEYKADLKSKLAEKKAKDAKTAMENEAIEKAAANATIDLPACMTERRIDATIDRYNQMLAQQGIKFDQYLEMTGSTMEQARENLRPSAEKAVRESLVLEAIAAKENLTPSDEEIDAKLKELAGQYGIKEADEFVKSARPEDREYIAGDLKIELAIKFLVDNASYVTEA